MGAHAPATKARTRCDRKIWDDQKNLIVSNCANTKRWEMSGHAPDSKARTSCDRELRNLYTTRMWEMWDHAPASEARTRCDRSFWSVEFIYFEIIGMKYL